MEPIVAVIVTYNRLELLKEAVKSVKSQSYALKEILVVDNGSTDGTGDWLNQQQGLTILTIKDNIGASGGYYSGIKAAAAFNTKWMWVMDDDTLCHNNTLEMLMSKVSQVSEPIGFIGSKSVWTDGAPHYMGVPAIKPSFNNKIPFNKYDKLNLLLTETTSWVSLLINTEAVKEVGLPYKEFFFWSDDCEYTRRITEAGYLGMYCIDSVVLHKSPANYFPDFYRDTVNNLWKHKYGFRNEFFLKRKYKGSAYFTFWLVAKVGYTTFKLLQIRKDHHLKFIGTLCNSAWKSLFFNPKIEKV
jgi:rhamnopyranosyl-N-acetylglucosaminyl-diphospho-decaprenol beta-1,3/1,4-galactofuranosyltransferase